MSQSSASACDKLREYPAVCIYVHDLVERILRAH